MPFSSVTISRVFDDLSENTVKMEIGRFGGLFLFSGFHSAIHYWPPSIRCARPHGLELLVG